MHNVRMNMSNSFLYNTMIVEAFWFYGQPAYDSHTQYQQYFVQGVRIWATVAPQIFSMCTRLGVRVLTRMRKEVPYDKPLRLHTVAANSNTRTHLAAILGSCVVDTIERHLQIRRQVHFAETTAQRLYALTERSKLISAYSSRRRRECP